MTAQTTPVKSFTITVPASSSNIGPGFDVLGLTLATYLTLRVQVFLPCSDSDQPRIELRYTGDGSASVSLVPEKNLIATTALYVLSSNGLDNFPGHTIVHVNNSIPFGRGLGSSGAAVVAGVMLGNELGGFGMSKERLLDYCLSIERHPDNVTAALMGGFVASYLRELDVPERHISETCPHSEEEIDGEETNVDVEDSKIKKDGVPSSKSCKTNGTTKHCAVTAAYEQRSAPPKGIGHFIRLGWSSRVKAVVIVPQFELSTAKARAVLPDRYERSDVVFNLQRLAVLTSALGQEEPDADLVYQAMQDRMHQPYRQHLIPGLPTILSSITPKTVPGCIGICLSGAGPTILALATENFGAISDRVCALLKEHGVDAVAKVLDIVQDGASCVYD